MTCTRIQFHRTPRRKIGNVQRRDIIAAVKAPITDLLHPATHLDRCEADTFGKGMIPYAFNTVGNLQRHQPPTAVKGFVSDVFHLFADRQIRQFAAIHKGAIPNAFHIVADGSRCQRSAIIKRVTAERGGTVGDRNLKKRGASAECFTADSRHTACQRRRRESSTPFKSPVGKGTVYHSFGQPRAPFKCTQTYKSYRRGDHHFCQSRTLVKRFHTDFLHTVRNRTTHTARHDRAFSGINYTVPRTVIGGVSCRHGKSIQHGTILKRTVPDVFHTGAQCDRRQGRAIGKCLHTHTANTVRHRHRREGCTIRKHPFCNQAGALPHGAGTRNIRFGIH